MNGVLVFPKEFRVGDIPESVRECVKGKSYKITPKLWDKKVEAPILGYLADVPDDLWAKCQDAIRDLWRVNLFAFCDNDGSEKDIINATLNDYGLKIQEK